MFRKLNENNTIFSVLFLTSLTVPNIISPNYAIVLPSQHGQESDLQDNEISTHDVIDWELNHCDLIFGSNANQTLKPIFRPLATCTTKS